VKEPFRIAVQNLRERFPDASAGFAIAVDDPAQVRLINTQHLRQAVLTHANGINPQLQIRVNVSIWGQSVTVPVCRAGYVSQIIQRRVGNSLNPYLQLDYQKGDQSIVQHFVGFPQMRIGWLT
jgi:hypothetical protein